MADRLPIDLPDYPWPHDGEVPDQLGEPFGVGAALFFIALCLGFAAWDGIARLYAKARRK